MEKAPGAPLLTADAPPTAIVTTFGNFDANDGGEIRICGDQLIFAIRLQGEAEIGVSIDRLLEAVQEYGHKYGS